MAQTYNINHTVEEINRKLSLIDENKNWLPYPYDSSTIFPASLNNVGDGSFLTTGETTTDADYFLNDCVLPAGTYVTSLEVTDIIESKTAINPDFSLKVVIDGTEQSTSFTLSTEKTAKVYLVVQEGSPAKNLLIKPQIEEGAVKTDWVPYMDKIGSYVDERFNGISAKFRVLENLIDLADVLEIEYE